MPTGPVIQVTDFLRRHGACRMRNYTVQPLLDSPQGAGAEVEDDSDSSIDHGVEQAPDAWEPIDVREAAIDQAEQPRRFVDGSHVHQTVSWVRDPEGRPIPVELAEIGGICMRARPGAHGMTLVREFEVVERVACMIVDSFPWEEIESFAADLSATGLRLLPARPPEDEDGVSAVCFDFERMRQQTTITTRREMEVLEEVAWARDAAETTLVDGRLSRFHHRSVENADVIGVIKQQKADYLHDQGWRVLYALEPGRRTPAFELSIRNLKVLSWYLKLDGPEGSMPNWGVIRIEIPAARFVQTGGDYGYLNRLSRGILEMRCRSLAYSRAPVSLEPIVRAEESLKSLFTPLGSLVERFYRQTGL